VKIKDSLNAFGYVCLLSMVLFSSAANAGSLKARVRF